MHEQEPTKNDESEKPEEDRRPKPRIYVASLADYNEGRLHGAWIDAAQTSSEIMDAVRAMLRDSPSLGAEEWAIHDYEGFGPLSIHEYEDFETVARVAAGIVEHGEGFGAYAEFIDCDADLLDGYEDAYMGEYESGAELAEELLEGSDIDEVLASCRRAFSRTSLSTMKPTRGPCANARLSLRQLWRRPPCLPDSLRRTLWNVHEDAFMHRICRIESGIEVERKSSRETGDNEPDHHNNLGGSCSASKDAQVCRHASLLRRRHGPRRPWSASEAGRIGAPRRTSWRDLPKPLDVSAADVFALAGYTATDRPAGSATYLRPSIPTCFRKTSSNRGLHGRIAKNAALLWSIAAIGKLT